MKVNWSMDFTDDSLRKVKQALGGRSGKATRAEVRIWLAGVVLGKLTAMEPVRVRRRRLFDVPGVLPVGRAGNAKSASVPMDPATPCTGCTKPLSEHVGIRRDCPLSKSVKPGSVFKGV